MSDSKILDIGDVLILKVNGYPVGKVQVVEFEEEHANVVLLDHLEVVTFKVPLNIQEFDAVDGVAHNASPLSDENTILVHPEI